MPNKPFQLISPLGNDSMDLEKIRSAFKDFLLHNSIIKDVNFEGSNISILVDMIAYAIYGINSTNSLLFNETILTTSTIRENIIQLAKNIGYHITRSMSSKMKIEIKPKLPFATGENIIMQRGHKFIVNDITFYNKTDILINKQDPIEIEIEEGILLDHTIDDRLLNIIQEPTSQFILPYKGIEENSIRVYVKNNGSSDFIRFDRVHSLLDFEETKNQYFEDYDADSGFVVIRFKFASIGKILQKNDTIKVELALTIGSMGNNLIDVAMTPLSIKSNINNTFEVELVDKKYNKSIGGADEESNISIKENAPRFYNSANRLVTENDYEAHLEKDSFVDRAGCFGGENMPVVNKGRIYFSAISQDKNLKFLPNVTVAHLLDLLAKKRIVSTERVFWQPIYLILNVDIKILGHVVDLVEKQQQILEVFERTYESNFRSFKTDIYYAKIVRDIEAIFANDKGASIEVQLKPIIRLYPENFDTLFEVDYNCRVINPAIISQHNKLLVSMPTLPSEFFLVKGTDKMSASGKDVKSFLLNGWKMIKSTQNLVEMKITGDQLTVEANQTTMPDGSIVINPSTIKYNGFEIAVWDHDRSEIMIDPNFKNTIDGLPNKYYDIALTFGDGCVSPISTKLHRNMFPVLGDINFS